MDRIPSGDRHLRPEKPAARPRPRLVPLHPDRPDRPLDWRWRKAGRLLELDLRWSRRRDDEPTREAKLYLAGLRRCRRDAGRDALARRMPAVAGAVALRDGEPRLRAAVEARLLAGLPIGVVAARSGLDPGIVERYENLFFNVVDRLGARGWLTHRAIGIHPGSGPTAGDYCSLWRFFAVSGGPVVLEAVLADTWGAAGLPPGSGCLAPGLPLWAGPTALAVAALTLPAGGSGRLGPAAILRLAVSERRHAEAAARLASLVPRVLPRAPTWPPGLGMVPGDVHDAAQALEDGPGACMARRPRLAGSREVRIGEPTGHRAVVVDYNGGEPPPEAGAREEA
jgi:hypothetical protein